MIIKGTGQAIPQADEQEWVPGIGWTTIKVWVGPKDAIGQLALSLAAAGGYSRIRTYSGDNVTYRLNAHFGGVDDPGNDVATETWELIGQGIQEDLFNHPKSRALDSTEIGSIEEYNQNRALLKNSSPALTTADGTSLWLLLKNNQNAYQDTYYVLRQTQVAAQQATLNVSVANVQKIHTLYNLPAMTDEMWNTIYVIPSRTAPAGYTYGYLKQPPHITQTVGGRVQVVQEWWLYSWSNYVYETV